MIKYKFNVGDALERAGFNMYKAKTTGLISQETLKKIKNEDTNISAKSLNSLCLILDMHRQQPPPRYTSRNYYGQ